MSAEERPQLTQRGRGVLAAAAGLLVAARLFGSVELAGLAAAAAAAVGLAAVLVGRAPLTYRAERWLAPMRVGAGDPAQARWRFTNIGGRLTNGIVVATDPLSGAPVARCLVPTLGPGAMAEAADDLPTGRRGAISVGPLEVSACDPLGLVERRVQVAGTARLVVHPRIHPVLALPGSSTRQARRGTTRPARSPRGDDFFALRQYEIGDDLRRVHWRSTARMGDLMLRQDELRFGEVATVLLDTRAAAHRGDSFERALEVAASVAAALVEQGRRLRFVTTGGFDVVEAARTGGPLGPGGDRWAAILDHLAVVAPDAGASDRFAFAVQSIRHHPSGPLAAVVGAAIPAELAALGALRPRLGSVLIAQTHAGGPDAPAAHTVPGAVLVPIGDIREFPEAWNQAVLLCGRREVAPR